ncbi:hypothetical protein [Pseudactinotalea suaedae]|uniref:hypothetical protein n=1 Tax=Pseudactinotalea suaedae TaxID=1524924 RepID=UPI0012E1BDC8|nr:hypothetical protein [Pseudactinotalea suaedae]
MLSINSADVGAGGATARPRRTHPTPLPRPRGPISGALRTLLTGPPTRDADILASSHITELWSPAKDAPWWRSGEDAALALVYLAELRRRGLEGVDDGWDGHPLLATARWTLSGPVRRGLERLADADEPHPRATGYAVVRQVIAMAARASAPSQSALACGFGEGVLEIEVALTAVQRLRERDARASLLPSLAGAPRRLLARTVAVAPSDDDVDDEREALAAVLRGLDLADSTGANLDALPGPALWRIAVLDHLVSHRSSRAAALGWLAAADALAAAGRFVTGDALRTHGLPAATAEAWDACVIGHMSTLEAAEHLVDAEPQLATDVLLGARACVTAATAVQGAVEEVRRLRRQPPTGLTIDIPVVTDVTGVGDLTHQPTPTEGLT